ncbi:MAG: hypothetical protein RL217_1020 [Pseudomonadota bacterium]|jgi:transcriptional regulator with XRE-family HTH domain
MKKTISSQSYYELVQWLKAERIQAELTMRELGARLGAPHTFVQKTETMERRLDVAEYVAYCQALGVNPEDGIRLITTIDKALWPAKG